MNRLAIVLCFALLFLGVFVAPRPVECAECGIRPIKPIVPIGCKDLAPLCVCDSSGTHCAWQWTCVK